jgi:hypothetical protein
LRAASRTTQKITRLVPTGAKAMICAQSLAESSSSGSRSNPMIVCAITASAATRPTIQGPPNNGVIAGAATSSGPR